MVTMAEKARKSTKSTLNNMSKSSKHPGARLARRRAADVEPWRKPRPVGSAACSVC